MSQNNNSVNAFKINSTDNIKLRSDERTFLSGALEVKGGAYIKKDLFVKPFVPGAQFGNPNDQSAAFPVYRENNNKMYLPRFYGIQRYGVPDRCDIEPGDDIDVPFELSLRDYQQNIVDIYCNHCLDLSRPKRRVSKFHAEPWFYHLEISVLDPFHEEDTV